MFLFTFLSFVYFICLFLILFVLISIYCSFLQKNLIDIRSIRKKRNEELREKIKNVKEITLKSSMELDEQVSLLAKHRLDYKRKSKRASR